MNKHLAAGSQEVLVLRTLANNPHIAKVEEVFEDPYRVYIVLE